MDDSTFSGEHMSSPQVEHARFLHSEAIDASADGGLGCVQAEGTWHRVLCFWPLKMCARQNKDDHISMEQNK